MPDPVILVVDDDTASLSLVDAELRKRYGSDYRVVARQSAHAALEALRRLREAGEPVALVLADQWMPEMPGADFLGEARAIDPVAKRVMLVSWGDETARDAIAQSCAVGQIEYFVTKPWMAGTDERFHRQIGEFLYEWTRVNRTAFETVKVVGEQWAQRSHELRDLLGRNGIPFGFYTPDSEAGESILSQAGLGGEARLPVVMIFGGTVLSDPSNRELSEALGARRRPGSGQCDLAVIGGGPAGLAAAVISASEGLDTVVLEREALGGQAGHSALIQNYLGFPSGISGSELAGRAYEQGWQFGAHFLLSSGATALREDGEHRIVTLDDGSELRARSLIVATGISYRRLQAPRLEALAGAGVFYGSVSSEARSLEGFHVYIVGAANSAGQAALHVARYADHVTILTRRGGLDETMSSYLVRLIEGTGNVSYLPGTRVVDGDGEGRLMRLTLEDVDSGERREVPAEALFVMIGATPHTDWLADVVARDADGYILTGADLTADAGSTIWAEDRAPYPLETSMPGVFAVGDVRSGSVKRVAAAAGEGAMAVRHVHEYLAGPRSAAAGVRTAAAASGDPTRP